MSNEFETEDEPSTDEAGSGDVEEEGELVLTHYENGENGGSVRGEETKGVVAALAYLSKDHAVAIKNALIQDRSILAELLEDLTPSNVPYRHSFTLTDENPIRIPGRRMPAGNSELVWKGM